MIRRKSNIGKTYNDRNIKSVPVFLRMNLNICNELVIIRNNIILTLKKSQNCETSSKIRYNKNNYIDGFQIEKNSENIKTTKENTRSSRRRTSDTNL